MSPPDFVKLPMSARRDFSARFKRTPRNAAAEIELWLFGAIIVIGVAAFAIAHRRRSKREETP